MRWSCLWSGAVAAALVAVSAGCVRNKIVVRVNPDGSGDILVTRMATVETVRLIEMQLKQAREQMEAKGGTEMAPPQDYFYNEEALKREAALFGPDVVFVAAQKQQRAGSRGATTRFHFADIRRVAIRPESYAMEVVRQTAEMFEDAIQNNKMTLYPASARESFTFNFEPGEVASLTVRPPVYPRPTAAPTVLMESELDKMRQMMSEWNLHMGGEKNPFGLTGNETPVQAMAKILKDCEMEVSVEVAGQIVESDARHPHAYLPSRFIFLRANPETLASSDVAMPAIAWSMEDGASSLAMFGAMIGTPDTIIETNRAVSVRFK